jgi:tetratricopeptide (TPR) repeat protein
MRRLRALGLSVSSSLSLSISVSVLALSPPAGAETGAAKPAEASPAKPTADRKLPELPTPPSIELKRPEAADLAEVDALLGRIVAETAADRDSAVRELLEAEPKHVSAIRFRLGSVADNADKEAMKRLLLKTRRELLNKKDDEESDKPSAGVDYLAGLIDKAEPKSEAWRNLVTVLALSRMLESIGNVEAVRGLIEVYARFGEFLRISTQNALTRLGDKAVPALIEAQRHPAEKIAKWAVRQLDMLGKGIPSEAVQTQDQAALADVLRAYGRTRNPDAVRIVVSFANSERTQIREASRQAVALLGEVGSWQLRDTYENVVGKKPPRDWAWERTARELFAEFDRLRVAQVSKFFEEGQAARNRDDFEKMRESFDKLLAYDPSFEQRTELAAGYVAYAKATQDKSRAAAIAALRRAERLDPTLKDAGSLRLTLEAEELEEHGIADSTLLERALEADAQNSRAKSALARFERGEPKRSENARYVAAGSILAVALAAIAFLLLRKPKLDVREPPPPGNAAPTTSTDPSGPSEPAPPAEATTSAEAAASAEATAADPTSDRS